METTTRIVTTSLKVSIDEEDLQIFIEAGWINMNSVDKL